MFSGNFWWMKGITTPKNKGPTWKKNFFEYLHLAFGWFLIISFRRNQVNSLKRQAKTIEKVQKFVRSCFIFRIQLKSAWNPSCIGVHFQVASFLDQSSKGNTKPFFSLNLKLGKEIRQHWVGFFDQMFSVCLDFENCFFKVKWSFSWISSSVF